MNAILAPTPSTFSISEACAWLAPHRISEACAWLAPHLQPNEDAVQALYDAWTAGILTPTGCIDGGARTELKAADAPDYEFRIVTRQEKITASWDRVVCEGNVELRRSAWRKAIASSGRGPEELSAALWAIGPELAIDPDFLNSVTILVRSRISFPERLLNWKFLPAFTDPASGEIMRRRYIAGLRFDREEVLRQWPNSAKVSDKPIEKADRIIDLLLCLFADGRTNLKLPVVIEKLEARGFSREEITAAMEKTLPQFFRVLSPPASPGPPSQSRAFFQLKGKKGKQKIFDLYAITDAVALTLNNKGAFPPSQNEFCKFIQKTVNPKTLSEPSDTWIRDNFKVLFCDFWTKIGRGVSPSGALPPSLPPV